MPKYTVDSPLRHDGEDYGIDDTVSMKAEQAEILLKQGVLISVAEDNPAEDMTVPVLIKELKSLKVEIPRGAKKEDLVELYNNATSAVDDNGKPE